MMSEDFVAEDQNLLEGDEEADVSLDAGNDEVRIIY